MHLRTLAEATRAPLTPRAAHSLPQEALLLSSFFQGYLITQIPGGWAAQKWGGKGVAVLNLLGNGVLLLLPMAANHSVRALSTCLGVVGLCQGPLVPSVSVMQSHWLPTGPMRAWALTFVSMGGRLARMVAAGLGPLLAEMFGWRSIAYLYGSFATAFAVLFAIVGQEKPGTAIKVKFKGLTQPCQLTQQLD